MNRKFGDKNAKMQKEILLSYHCLKQLQNQNKTLNSNGVNKKNIKIEEECYVI